MRKKQRIPGCLKNGINKKPEIKYMEATSDIMGKTLKITPLYMTVLGAFHVFYGHFLYLREIQEIFPS